MTILHPLAVEFPAADGLLLPGFLFEPATKTKKALIVLHGNGSSTIVRHFDTTQVVAEEMAAHGIAYFVFNNRGAGYVTKLDKVNERGEKESAMYGTAYELIKECLADIDGAVSFLKKRGYTDISLQGFSTGANKICLYNFYKPENDITRYILACGGDDTGLYYAMWGKEKFTQLLNESRQAVASGKGRGLVPQMAAEGEIMSYQSLFDTINLDGDYNVFPYYEVVNGLRLATKPLFQEYASIRKPTLVVYGDQDEYCYGKVPQIVDLLKQNASDLKQQSFTIIQGGDHRFTGKQLELARLVSSFISK